MARSAAATRDAADAIARQIDRAWVAARALT